MKVGHVVFEDGESRISTKDHQAMAYLEREVQPHNKNQFRFRVSSDAGGIIEIGIALLEILDDGENPVIETIDIWSVRLRDGTKFTPERGEDPYIEKKIGRGDIIAIEVADGTMSVAINGESLGVAFESEKLSEWNLYPYVKIS